MFYIAYLNGKGGTRGVMETVIKKKSWKPEIKVILYGVGAIGSQIARLLLKKKGFKIVGAIDASPKKVGKDLGEVIKTGAPLGIVVSKDPEELLSNVDADIALHATSSFLKDVYPQPVSYTHLTLPTN